MLTMRNTSKKKKKKRKRETIIESLDPWSSMWRVALWHGYSFIFLPALFTTGDSIIQEGGM